ncbi:UDP-glucose 4-epimerase GalE [Streptomyces sp. NPDC020096]
MKILITGGAGFIGSTIASACLDSGIQPVIVDNLATGRREFAKDRTFYEGDVSDGDLIDTVFAEHPDIHTAIHCASLIVVPESVANPLRYYTENVAKGVQFLGHLVRNGCERVIFSSSASIYAPDENFTVDEDSALDPASPYAQTKFMFETILKDTATSGAVRAISLRYFNPIGADPKLRTGLQIRRPTHALGRIIDSFHSGEPFTITGTDWPTRDGSGIRDYVHVWDLANAHVSAVRQFDTVLPEKHGDRHAVVILASGTGTTVRELVTGFENVTGKPLPVVEIDRRPGDAVGTYSRSKRAQELFGWQPQLTVEDGIHDSLRWHSVRDSIIGTD